MIEILHYNYRKARSIYQSYNFITPSIGPKHFTLISKKFPFIAKQLPVFFYGSVKFTSIKGKFKSLEK
jgi:hypothetical protein